MKDAWLTPREVAQRLKVSYGAVLLLIRRGDLPAVRVTPKLLRIQQSDLSQYLARRSFLQAQAHSGQKGESHSG